MILGRVVNIGGKPHRLACFRVESRDERGVPERLTHVPDDRVVELSRDARQNHFVLCWVSVAGFAPVPRLAGWDADHGGDPA